jgi:Sulfotransferase domain
LTILFDFDWARAYYPVHIRRPLPWFEVLHTNPVLDSVEGRQRWVELHKRFQKDLEDALPEDRLLIFNVKQGWKPLIPFLRLNESLADEVFPNVNDRNSVQTVRHMMDVVAVLLPVWVLVALYLVTRMVRAVLEFFTRKSIKVKTV